jgi:hypothetical protein
MSMRLERTAEGGSPIISLRIGPELHAWLAAYCQQYHRQRSDVVRMALADFLGQFKDVRPPLTAVEVSPLYGDDDNGPPLALPLSPSEKGKVGKRKGRGGKHPVANGRPPGRRGKHWPRKAAVDPKREAVD